MQPWQVALGVTAALLPLSAMVARSQLSYFDGYWSLIWFEYSYHLVVSLLMMVLVVYLFLYQVVRKLSLGDVGSRVALLDKSIREGRGADSELSGALQREEAGQYES